MSIGAVGRDATATDVSLLAMLLTGTKLTLRDLLDAADQAGMTAGPPQVLLSPLGSTTALTERTDPHAAPVQSTSTAMSVAEFYTDVVVPTAQAASRDEHRGGGMFRTYEPYWKLMVWGYPYQRAGIRTNAGEPVGASPVPPSERLYLGVGDRTIADLRYRDLKEVLDWVRIRSELSAHWRTLRREDRGRAIRKFDHEGALRNAVGAIRYVYAQAVLDQQLPAERDISLKLKKPPKRHSNRRGFTDLEYDELWAAVISGGDDPELDRLIVYTVLITGARREGLINLSRRDIDTDRVTIWLDEKNGKISEQPATSELLEQLLAFATARGSTHPEDPVFCYLDSLRRGRPHRLTDRRFDTLHTRIQKTLPWADRLGVTIHFCRHHIITAIERASSEAVAARFARHSDGHNTTRGYDKATGEEVCAALSAVTGFEHPLAHGGW